MTRVWQESELAEKIAGASTLDRIDYFDVFTGKLGRPDKTPEHWARAVVVDAAALPGQVVWRVILGLRLGPRDSSNHIGGWRIGARGEDWIRLEAKSWLLVANIFACTEGELVSVVTMLRYLNPLATAIWAPVGLAHRRALPGLMIRASRSTTITKPDEVAE